MLTSSLFSVILGLSLDKPVGKLINNTTTLHNSTRILLNSLNYSSARKLFALSMSLPDLSSLLQRGQRPRS